MNKKESTLLCLATIILMLAGPFRLEADESRPFQNGLEKFLRERSLPAETVEIVNTGVLRFPEISQTLLTIKLRNKLTDAVEEIVLDRSGRPIDPGPLLDRVGEVVRREKIEAALHRRLNRMGREETVEVALWMAAPDDPLDRPTPEEIDEKGIAAVELEREAAAEAKRLRLAELRTPLLKAIHGLGASMPETSDLAPVITAHLNKGAIRKMAERADVDGIFLVRENRPFLDVAAATVTAPPVWARGVAGANERVAVIEREGIFFENPYLTGINRLGGACFGLDGFHATMAAGNVASTHPTYRGIAFGAVLLGGEACSWSDSALKTATTWSRDNGAQAHSNSWGANTAGTASGMSRFHDTVVRDWGVTVVDAAGNCAGGCQVAAPALAYNVIAVGAFNDRNTAAWGDDAIAGFSSYIDPVSAHRDREKPEVAAPGVNIITTNGAAPWITPSPGVNGTSFSTPQVAGGAALLFQRNPLLRFWPEGVKAILMATAIHNIEGASRLSERDGAGGISLDHADQVAADPNKWRTSRIIPASFDATRSLNFTFTAAAGQVVRAVIAWNATPSYTLYAQQPGVDLDLYVYRPSGAAVAQSVSWDNTYEIVQFTAPESGVYRLRIVNNRFQDAFTYLGVAWKN